MTGGAGNIVIVILVLPLPATLVAVTVYVVAEDKVVGVPVISPVLALSDKPAGKPGLTDQLAAAPPIFAGDHVPIAVPDG